MAGLPPYDWREIGHDDQFGLCDEWFLIHYGWRGTDTLINALGKLLSVSNPLRVEGAP